MGTLVNETTRTQLRDIRNHLEREGYIDRDTALLRYECDALRSRISDLRHDPVNPMNIETVWKTKKNKYGHTTNYAAYRLVREDETA